MRPCRVLLSSLTALRRPSPSLQLRRRRTTLLRRCVRPRRPPRPVPRPPPLAQSSSSASRSGATPSDATSRSSGGRRHALRLRFRLLRPPPPHCAAPAVAPSMAGRCRGGLAPSTAGPAALLRIRPLRPPPPHHAASPAAMAPSATEPPRSSCQSTKKKLCAKRSPLFFNSFSNKWEKASAANKLVF